MAGYLIEERRRRPVITASHEDNILNKFRIWKERHVQMRKPGQSPGRMKNSSYYIAPVGVRTHTVASNMVKVSHSAAEAVHILFSPSFLQRKCLMVSKDSRLNNAEHSPASSVGCILKYVLFHINLPSAMSQLPPELRSEGIYII